MMRKTGLLCILFIVSLFAANSVCAVTFFDSFDDPTFTANNWIELAPTWSLVEIDGSTSPPDYGARGEYTPTPGVDANAVAIANNGYLFNYLNLSVSTELSIQHRIIYEDGGDTPKDEGGTIGFIDSVGGASIFASLTYNYFDGWIHGAGIGTNDGDQIENEISGIEYDRFYYLDLIVDGDGIITSHLFDDTGQLINTITESNAAILSNGVVGIVSDADTVFNNFSAAAPVPLPSTLLLLGSGLVGLAGIGRKKFVNR